MNRSRLLIGICWLTKTKCLTGAVIARECGLPCIVGAAGVTNIFQTGDLVRLNGSTGLLEKVQTDPLESDNLSILSKDDESNEAYTAELVKLN